MNTCRTCKYWLDRNNPKKDFSDGHWGRCKLAQMRASMAVMDSLLIAGGAMSGITDCDLHTHEAFGCNQWKEQCLPGDPKDEWEYCPYCGNEFE